MTAILNNASSYMDDLHRIAAHAGSTDCMFRSDVDQLVCYDVEQAALDNAVATLPPVYQTVDDVAAERDRRLAMGFDYNFGDERGEHRIATTEADMKGWDEVTKWANAAIALGNGSSTIDVLTETGPCTVTATEWQQVLMAATAARQPLWAASFMLQAMSPIPSDYATNEAYWQG